ncbi:MAG TPA: alpha/beta hydrolase [Elusimicrobiota bacterium]|nr:alpha/beta hydrolase [Elusimicrobiota bacterium]
MNAEGLQKIFFCLGLALFLSGCRAERLYYYPNAELYADPHNVGLEYEIVNYPSLNGKTLYGLYFQTAGVPRGTIVHFHGNYGNVSNHFPLSVFLLKYGFDVLIFDYQGYGASAGHPSPKSTVEDGVASVRYALSRRRTPEGGLGVFGQSLGAAVATVVAAEEPAVDAAVLEAGFTTYRAIGKDVLKRSLLTWPFAYIAPPLFVGRRCDPLDHIGRISPRPVLLIHGTKDRTIPLWMSRRLFERAKEPKTLWVVEGGEHLGYKRVAGTPYERAVSDFFQRAFEEKQRRLRDNSSR